MSNIGLYQFSNKPLGNSMIAQEVKRKLAAILRPDVKGDSNLTGAAEREKVSGPKMLNPCLFHRSLIKEKRL